MHIKHKQIRLIVFTCLVLLILGLFIGGSMLGSGSLFPPPWDKVVHLIFYATITVLVAISFPSLNLMFIFFIPFAVGCADEIHQIYVPGRHAGFDDLAADAIGIALTLSVIPWLRKLVFTNKN